jgi:uncharacterized protein (DUF2336 family)
MDVREFLDWMETAPAGQRADAAAALARSYLRGDDDEDALVAMEATLTVLLDDGSPDVRYALADALAASPYTPRHVIISLAADETEIAALVLQRSPVLIDAELVEIVAAASTPLQVAVASRPIVSSTVCATVAEVAEEEACLALLDNPGSEIAGISYRRIAQRFSDNSTVRDALLGRDIPPDVQQMLIHHVSQALASLDLVRTWVPDARARALSRDVCDRATVSIAAESSREDLPALVEHLRVTGQLTTALLLRAVCAGNVEFFEASLAALAHVPQHRIESLVRTGKVSGLRAAYGKAGLPPIAFDAFVAALDTWHRLAGEGGPSDPYRFTVQMVDAVLARYDSITDGEMNELAAMLRRFAADQAREAARDFARAAA